MPHTQASPNIFNLHYNHKYIISMFGFALNFILQDSFSHI